MTQIRSIKEIDVRRMNTNFISIPRKFVPPEIKI
jgi:hypothetical protein